jgi:two-component system phosphate regulon response regulator PhoB
MPHVLIVDDEPDLVRVIDFNLRNEGFSTTLCRNGEEALAALKRQVPDLVILDLMLPDLSGLEVCRQIRQNPKASSVPVIMLTAKGEEIDRVVGFQLGADDYVTKPFSVRELALRVRAVLRRSGSDPRTDGKSKIGAVELDLSAHRCFVGGTEIPLTALEFRLLSTFIGRVGRVLSREQLLEQVWEVTSELQTRTVDTHVKRLREKLGGAGDMIETVRGVGYRMSEPSASS